MKFLLFYVLFLFSLFLSAQNSSPSVNIDNNSWNPSFRSDSLKLDPSDPSIYYNKSLLFLKENKLGLAIAYLREAKLLAPRHLSTREALNFIKIKLLPKAFQSQDSFVQAFEASFGDYFVLPEILCLHWIISLFAFILLGKLFRDRRRAQLKSLTLPKFKTNHLLLCFLWLLLSSTLVLKLASTFESQGSVIKQGHSILRSGPLNESASIIEIPEGSLVTIKKIYNDWVQVKYNNNPLGWVALSDLLILTPDGFK